MYRTHTCGELRLSQAGQTVTLSGWVQRRRDFGGMSFIDLRDRYGLTQLAFNEGVDPAMLELARTAQREFVVQATGKVVERENKNPHLPTGEVEIWVTEFKVLNGAKTPPFTIEAETDGGEELRMKYRYLDIRRAPVREKLLLRNRINMSVRTYLNDLGFADVETPFLIKSTPEGARDIVVPTRIHPGQFYALPQSPQTFKQLLMVAGMDRYYQIVRCFRDEDLRADRQPEFTQIDCEMAFVEQEDILQTFEGLLKHIIREVHELEIGHAGDVAHFQAVHIADDMLEEAFKRLEDVLLFDKGHLAVDLREFGLAVGAQVLIAEAAHDLVVAVHAGDHQKLFEGLRRLGKRVELAVVHAGRNDKVAGAFRGALDQERRLDVRKTELVEVGPNRHVDAVAEQ